MIIGISGKKQSGKDLTASIIQYLYLQCYYPKPWEGISFEDFENFEGGRDCIDWDIVKFADKLKDVVCLLIRCTRKQLEDETFKNTPLGEEWGKWTFTGNFEGPYYATKEEVLRVTKHHYLYIKEHPESYSISYKDAVKESVQYVDMTPRTLLQILGTDCGRNMVHPNIWINSTMANYTPQFNWIISDVRFPGEVKAIHDRKGIVIRINRPSIISTDQHESETALDDYKDFNYTIENSGTIEELIETVRSILIHEKIIQ